MTVEVVGPQAAFKTVDDDASLASNGEDWLGVLRTRRHEAVTPPTTVELLLEIDSKPGAGCPGRTSSVNVSIGLTVQSK